MKLLDSDLLGILLALATFIVPAVSGVLEKKRKEKKRREAELYHQPEPEYPQQPEAEEIQEEPLGVNEEWEELFNVLMGRETSKEDILPDSFHEHQQQAAEEQEEPVEQEPADEKIPEPLYQQVEEKVESQTEHVEVKVSPEPVEGSSLKKRIKANPKEAVILSEILTPKFKEYN